MPEDIRIWKTEKKNFNATLVVRGFFSPEFFVALRPNNSSFGIIFRRNRKYIRFPSANRLICRENVGTTKKRKSLINSAFPVNRIYFSEFVAHKKISKMSVWLRYFTKKNSLKLQKDSSKIIIIIYTDILDSHRRSEESLWLHI